ncbi:MAG: hypothetical protein RL711_134 [Bacteroidota bacterium]|jgi:hypothetical protein
MKKLIRSGVVLLAFVSSANAQTNLRSQSTLKEYRNHPHWISMMDDSTVNYLEAKVAFDEFWRGKPTPEELNEGEVEGENEAHERNIFARLLKSDKQYKAEIVVYAFEHRKFNYWLRHNAPYVKEDGSLMSQTEREAMLQQELANRQAASSIK